VWQGITKATLADYFSPHVDVLSMGSLTQGYPTLDLSLKIVH
jgi:nicotinate-nucleotide pyrophosphorylase (carboxylating)